MIRFSSIVLAIALLALSLAAAQEGKPEPSSISLPTSKLLTTPSPGRIGSTNSFPATIAISPDGHYAALLNNGYGTQETLAMQSIAVLDLGTNQLADYPDKRFGEEVHPELGGGATLSARPVLLESQEGGGHEDRRRTH